MWCIRLCAGAFPSGSFSSTWLDSTLLALVSVSINCRLNICCVLPGRRNDSQLASYVQCPLNFLKKEIEDEGTINNLHSTISASIESWVQKDKKKNPTFGDTNIYKCEIYWTKNWRRTMERPLGLTQVYKPLKLAHLSHFSVDNELVFFNFYNSFQFLLGSCATLSWTDISIWVFWFRLGLPWTQTEQLLE